MIFKDNELHIAVETQQQEKAKGNYLKVKPGLNKKGWRLV